MLQVTRGDGKLKSFELLNVSYDPTRELWRNLNAMFISKYLRRRTRNWRSSNLTVGRARRPAR